jgi:hypothetical protein
MSENMSVYLEDASDGDGGGGGNVNFLPVTTSDVAVDANDGLDDTEDLEAHAGVPVVLPGAFAVSGLNEETHWNQSGYDSGADDCDDVECAPALEHQMTIDPTFGVESYGSVVATDSPLEAELYEVDEGIAALDILTIEQLAQQKKEAEDEQRRKDCRKVLLISIIVTVVVAAVAATVGVLVPRMKKTSDDDMAGANDGPFVLSGWDPAGSLTVPTDLIKNNIQFGTSVAISSDGSRLAVGLPGLFDPDIDSETSTGSIFIYDYVNGTSWMVTSVISSPETGGVVGKAVDISLDGKRVAVGVPSSSQEGTGYVEIFEQRSASDEWDLVNNIIRGDDVASASASFGGSVSFSSDGTIVAVGDTDASNIDNSINAVGLVQVFQDTNGTWTPIGDTVYGSQENGRFGRSLVLSGSGLVLAVSTLGNLAPGSVSTFRFGEISKSWEPMGSPLQGDSALESFGVSVTLSEDGMVLATGAPDFSRNGQEPKVGIVRTYRFDDDQQEWVQIGQPIEGENAFDNFGTSVALSADGNVLVVGAPDNDDYCENCGHVRVFANNQTSTSSVGGNPGGEGEGDDVVWIPVGTSLGTNETDGGKYGTAVAVSSNGTRVVGSAPFTTFNGFVSSVGQIHVFDLDDREQS